MVPAQQRFQAHKPAAGDVHLGLVVQGEALAFHRLAQGGFEIEPLLHLLVHGLRKEAPGVAAPRLGPVHGGLRLAQQARAIPGVVRVVGDADADAAVHLAAQHAKRRGERPQHRVCQIGAAATPARLGEGGDGEFVAADARHGIGHTEARRQAPGDGLQEHVAVDVAEGFIDFLEAIQVEVEQHHPPAHGPGLGERGHEALEQLRPVGQVGQGVESGQAPQARVVAHLELHRELAHAQQRPQAGIQLGLVDRRGDELIHGLPQLTRGKPRLAARRHQQEGHKHWRLLRLARPHGLAQALERRAIHHAQVEGLVQHLRGARQQHVVLHGEPVGQQPPVLQVVHAQQDAVHT